MYDFVDRKITSLDKGCRFLVWSMRSWSLVTQARQCPGPVLAPAFAKWQMIGGLQPFLRFMATLNISALDRMHFCSLGCGRVSEHEAIMLRLFASFAEGRHEDVRGTLGLIADEDAVADMLAAMAGLCAAMARARIIPRAASRATL